MRVVLSLLLVVLVFNGVAMGEAENLVRNGNFEQGLGGWFTWANGGCKGSAAIDTGVARSGGASLRITNPTPYGPHVYFRVHQLIAGIQPHTTYQISCWVKGEDVGVVWIGGGAGWNLRKPFPKGTYDWQQVTIEYTTGEDPEDFDLMVLTESETRACWVDEIAMVKIRTDEQKLATASQRLEEKIGARHAQIARIEQSPADVREDAYVKLGLAVARRFMQRVVDGAPDGRRQSIGWSMLQLDELQSVLDQTERHIERMTAGQALPGKIAWPAGGPVEIKNGVFHTAKDDGSTGPFYFSGYGHFDALFRDLPGFRELGVSLIQEGRVGPSAMNEDGSLRENALRSLQGFADAEKHGIKVDYLLSPHYFPEWGYQQAADLRNHNSGFISYNIDHPRGRAINEQWIRSFIPKMHERGSVFSYCLTNEPVYVMSGRDQYSRPKFERYLEQLHGDIAKLNGLYGSDYESFAKVPVPGHALPEGDGPRRAYYDWCRFNQVNFVEWHRWLGELIKSIDPSAKTHAKIMVFYAMDRDKLHWGIDPELFCEISDIAGCDAYAFMTGGSTFSWHGHAFWYDLLHSFRGQPVFNSENHIIPDGTGAHHVPAAHTHAVLWQGGLHHMGASTIWVWEEASHPDLRGSIYFRPGNVYAAGRAMLDQARLADEVTAINQARPRVALLYSWPSIFWQPQYKDRIARLYTHLNFLGEKVTFVSERQLADATAADVDVIISPAATHVHAETLAALEAFVQRGGKLLVNGEDDLRYDEYHREHAKPPAAVTGAARVAIGDDVQANHRHVATALAELGLQLRRVRGVENDELLWNVEFRVVPHENVTLVPMINHGPQVQTVHLPDELAGEAIDLLSGEAVDTGQIELRPMTPRLLRVQRR